SLPTATNHNSLPRIHQLLRPLEGSNLERERGNFPQQRGGMEIHNRSRRGEFIEPIPHRQTASLSLLPLHPRGIVRIRLPLRRPAVKHILDEEIAALKPKPLESPPEELKSARPDHRSPDSHESSVPEFRESCHPPGDFIGTIP